MIIVAADCLRYLYIFWPVDGCVCVCVCVCAVCLCICVCVCVCVCDAFSHSKEKEKYSPKLVVEGWSAGIHGGRIMLESAVLQNIAAAS